MILFYTFRVIMELGNKAVALVERFPWIKKTYSALITVQTTSEILRNRNVQTNTLLDTDIVFAKLIEFWNTVANATAKNLVSFLLILIHTCCKGKNLNWSKSDLDLANN